MPITITPQNPAGLVGPGLALRLESSLPSPFPPSAVWTMTFHSTSDQFLFYEGVLHQTSGIVFNTPGITVDWQPPLELQQDVLKEGDQVTVNANVQLQGGGPADDTGQVIAPWSSQSGVPALIAFHAQTSAGLTPEQAQQLDQTHQSTFPEILVDSLTLVPLASVPSAGPINSPLPNPCFGVIVRIANVPEDLVPNTPDGDYWLPSLAVVRIFRGSDLWKRVPVHTSSKLVELLDESIVAGLTAVTATQWLLNLSVQVTFRAGVTGTVFLMLLP